MKTYSLRYSSKLSSLSDKLVCAARRCTSAKMSGLRCITLLGCLPCAAFAALCTVCRFSCSACSFLRCSASVCWSFSSSCCTFSRFRSACLICASIRTKSGHCMYVQYHARRNGLPARAYFGLQGLLGLLDALLLLHNVRPRPGLLSACASALLVLALLRAEACERLVLLLDSVPAPGKAPRSAPPRPSAPCIA